MLPGALRNPTRQGILTTPDSTYEWMSFGEHVWTTPAVQELSCGDEHRSGASMCSACSCSTAWLLALMKSADRIPNHVIALEALCSPGFVRSPV